MAVLGIVAEFNPFHNGHLHLVQEALKKESFSAAVCVMSGNFLQRGEPALCDKWSRAEMAVRCGLDLVIELPFCFAVRSAWHFARGAVNLLAQTGVVTHLAFGSESGDITRLNAIASVLASEPDEFKTSLRSQLDKGLNYPAARSLALQDYLSSTPDLEHLLIGPNNILSIEYLRVIKENCLPMIPLTIPRQGNYHDPSLGYFPSATAIRKSLEQNQSLQHIAPAMPKNCLERLKKDISLGRAPVHSDALEQAIFFQLRSRSTAQLQEIYEVADGEVAGAENTTGNVLRPALQIIKTAPGISAVSGAFIMIVPNSDFGDKGTFVFADCAVTPVPTEEQMAEFAQSSIGTAVDLCGMKDPKVGMLSFSTKGSASHEVVDKVANAVRIAKERFPELKVDGEFQADAALVPSVGSSKAPGSPVAGECNVLIFPDLQAGNIGYKLVQRLAKAEAIGPILQGIAKPVNDLSRGCSVEDIVNVVAMTAVRA
jgi:phosphate acetyltransferase